MATEPISVRLPDSLLSRLEELRPLLEELPEYAAQGELSRSDLVRIALAHGLERLEETLRNRDGRPEQTDLLDT